MSKQGRTHASMRLTAERGGGTLPCIYAACLCYNVQRILHATTHNLPRPSPDHTMRIRCACEEQMAAVNVEGTGKVKG